MYRQNSAASGDPFIVLPQDARVYDIGRGEARILIGSEQSSGTSWLGTFLSSPGRKTSLHIHFGADEQFFVQEGFLSVWLDGLWHDLPAGAIAVIPRGTSHALQNRSKHPVRFLGSGNPAGFERFFADVESAARKHPYGSPEFIAQLAKLYVKYDSKLLGPPPED